MLILITYDVNTESKDSYLVRTGRNHKKTDAFAP